MTKLYSILITAVTFSVFNPLQVRSQAFTNESISFSAGYGLGTFTNSISNLLDQYSYYDVNHNEFGPVYLKAERGVSDHIGIGLNFAYVNDDWKFKFNDGIDSLGNPVNYTETDTRSSYSIMARVNFHIGSSKKVDPYVGFGLGYRNATWKSSTRNPQGNSGIDLQTYMPFGFEFTIGVRYLFTPNFGAYTEWGAAKSVFQFGVSYYLPGIARTPVNLIRP